VIFGLHLWFNRLFNEVFHKRIPNVYVYDTYRWGHSYYGFSFIHLMLSEINLHWSATFRNDFGISTWHIGELGPSQYGLIVKEESEFQKYLNIPT